MAKDQASYLSLRRICYILLVLSSLSSFLFLYRSNFSITCFPRIHTPVDEDNNQELNLLTFPSSWNSLNYPSEPPPRFLKIAVFVKKWPDKHRAGGLERHASTLHRALAKRGHELHIFTSSSTNTTSIRNLYFHLSKPTAAGYLDQATIWNQFQAENLTKRPFDVVHTESVGLMHTRARNLTNLAVSWHGIAYESIHSDIIQELLRAAEVAPLSILKERVVKVVEEIRFFPRYAHHVATSDHVGDVLKRIYMLPEERVHIILNGVDEELLKPVASNGRDFGVPESMPLILGIAGRLVKDKGHPLMFEALKQIFNGSSELKDSVSILVAGDGPLLEAMLVGKPLMATKLASIANSVVVSKEIGYTFSPTVDALKKALYEVWKDGRVVLQQKGRLARERALKLFTATKMAAAYERLFLCIEIQKDIHYWKNSCKNLQVLP